MTRGELWWADIPEPEGSAPGFRRPVLVVQADAFTQSRIKTVICAVITSNCALADAPGNVFIDRSESGLPKDSVVNASQIVTLDKTMLTERIGSIARKTMHRIDDGIRLVLDIT